MENSNILTSLLTVPLAGAVMTWFVPRAIQRIYALFAALIMLALTGYVVFQQSVIGLSLPWIPEIGLNLSLRLDSISRWFILLNAITAVVAMSLKGPWYRKHSRLFTSLGFFLVFALNAAFLSDDLILFYLSYEAVFIPMIFMVGLWGTGTKALSVFRFFLMSFFGSVMMLISMIALVHFFYQSSGAYSSHLSDMIQVASVRDSEVMKWCFLGFFLAFAIKVPLFPFHGWLKEVYVNAPMPATIWMSAILSKLGVYGFIRFVIPLFMVSAKTYQGELMAISAISIIFAALLALRSNSPKEVLSYSSMSHLGFVMLGVFTLSQDGVRSAILLSVGHTLVSAALFFSLSAIEEREGELSLKSTHGLASRYPVLFSLTFVALLASVSLPGTLNFVGEFGVLITTYSVSVLSAVVAGLGVVLGAIYMLRYYQGLGLGSAQGSGDKPAQIDLGGLDFVILAVLVGFLVYFGFNPNFILKG